MAAKPYPLLRHIIPSIIGLWIREVSGLENLPTDGPFILAPNHSSYIEHLMIGSVVIPRLNKFVHTLAKKEHFDKFFEAAWHRYLGAIPLDRRKGENALKVAVSHLRSGKIILIYPEGTRTLTGRLQQGKTGVARLALWAKVPVVPLGIIGTFDILPKGRSIPALKKAELHFGKPLIFEKHYGKPLTKALLRKITATIMKEIAHLSRQEYKFD